MKKIACIALRTSLRSSRYSSINVLSSRGIHFVTQKKFLKNASLLYSRLNTFQIRRNETVPKEGSQVSESSRQKERQREGDIDPLDLMNIHVVRTPNPDSVKFVPMDQKVLDSGTMFFKTAVDAYCSPLAKALFMINGVKHVFLATDYVTVTKNENALWDLMEVEIINAIRTFYKSNRKVLTYDVQPTPETHEQEEDDEVVAAIKELLDTRIRPMVQEDGGDILFHKFEDGVVYLKLQGSCTGCPSSVDTLKGGVENMLMHYIPEVEEVRQVSDDEIEKVSLEQFAKTEKQIKEREKHAKNLERIAGRQLRKEEEKEEMMEQKERQEYYQLVENEKERLRDYHSDEHWR